MAVKASTIAVRIILNQTFTKQHKTDTKHYFPAIIKRWGVVFCGNTNQFDKYSQIPIETHLNLQFCKILSKRCGEHCLFLLVE